MTDKQDLIREIHEYVTTHGGENTATHLLVQAASAIQTQAEQQACDTQLFEFYGVSTTAELIAAQARHIEKLQAKLPPTPSFAPQRVREG